MIQALRLRIAEAEYEARNLFVLRLGGVEPYRSEVFRQWFCEFNLVDEVVVWKRAVCIIRDWRNLLDLR